MKTAVIYARYSSDNQTEQSMEGQLRVCKQYAENNNILIVNTYIDRAMTGTNDNRPDFQQMIKDSSKKEWDYVLVYKLDRFSRDKFKTAIHKKTLKDNGVKLISATENIPETPEGIILESLLEGMAEYYSAELSQKVKRGMNETRQKGNFTGGTLIYGYSKQDKKIIINEEQAEIVRYIYKQYSLDVYVKDIIKDLTNKHIYNKGKPFARNTIYNILKNEKYFGIYRHNDEIFENMYPRIVDKDVYDIVRKKINTNFYGKRSVEVKYLLRNKLVCGYCGKPISAECGTSSKGKKMRYYKCLGRKHNNGCTKSMVRKELLEDFVVDIIIEQLSKSKNIQAITQNIMQIQQEQCNGSDLIKTLLKEKKQAENSLENIVKAMEQGIINKTTQKRMSDLENKIEELEKEILIEKCKTITLVSEEEIKEYYIEALKLQADMLINYVVKQIKLYEDKIEMQFNTPLRESSNKNGLSFLVYAKTTEAKQRCFYLGTKKMPYVVQNRPNFEYKDISVILYV